MPYHPPQARTVSTAPSSRQPNILFLMTDQQRADALGCSGNPAIRTPNMDALAVSGVRFSQAVTPTPVCVAARMSFITGHRAARTHWMANSSLPGPTPELPTMMTLLLQSGYWTQGIGKMHFQGRKYGLRNLQTMEEGVKHWIDDYYIRYLRENNVRTRYPKGFRDLLYFQPQTCGIPIEHHMNTWVADRSIDFLQEHTRCRPNQPFFLWSSWISPHPPFAPCEPYDDMYDPADMDLPNFADRPIETLSPTLYSNRARLDGAHHDPDRMRRLRALYQGLVSHVDDGVGRILAELDALGLSDNTVVLFISDHGEMMGDHGILGKTVMYEESIKVPMVMRVPWLNQDQKNVPGNFSHIHIVPTLLSLMGQPIPENIPGRDITPVLEGGDSLENEDVFIEWNGSDGHPIPGEAEVNPQMSSPWRTIVAAERWKLNMSPDDQCELFDLNSDPGEMVNLYDDPTHANHVSDLARRLKRWQQENDDEVLLPDVANTARS